jgi:regulation of enolase protein 1 (concanavalin A-like superfamily)
MDQLLTISDVPAPFHWQRPPAGWDLSGERLTITAGPRTDLFVDPETGTETVTAPALTAAFDGDFQLSARVRADLTATFDAGVLVAYAHPRSWAKLCLERSPQGRATVVSVVTRGTSDDCNSFVVDGDAAWLRITRFGDTMAFHAATDGRCLSPPDGTQSGAPPWHLIRFFRHDEAQQMSAGFLAQSPTGEGCSAVFDDIGYSPTRPADLRSGE